jgi:DNA-binding winged helix-turn-helix (wHTH) protein/TolB-like protein/Tfp pilus assembly protein PilF
MSKPAADFYEFDGFRLDARKRLLQRAGEVLSLTPKAFDTLLALVESGGRVIEKDELMQAVWPDTIVEESALARNIYLLRKTLGESPEEHRYIVTVPGRGYRFVANVTPLSEEQTELVVATRTRASIVTEEEEETERWREGETERQREDDSLLSISPSPHLSVSPTPRLPLLPTLLGGITMLVILAFAYRELTRQAKQPATGAAAKSIAVLPFKPLVADSHDEILEMGMADVLITRLSNLKQIVVRPTSAVRKYTALDQDSLAAGRELKVDAVFDGNLQRVGERIRVTVRLLNTSDGTPVWAETFDEKFTDLFTVEDKLSEKLAAALALKLSPAERQLLARRYTENAEAFQAYLKGRYFWYRWTRADLQKAIAYFEQAIKVDPSYAPAYSGLSDSYHLLGYLGFAAPREAYPKVLAAAKQALQLDDTLGEAHLSLAKKMFFYDWDLPGAKQEIERALELSPNYSDAHSMYGTYWQALGQSAEAIAERKRAVDLDPVTPFTANAVGWSYFYAHQYDQAIECYKKALELDANFVNAYLDLGNVYYQKGMYDEAVAAWLKHRSLTGGQPETIALLKQAYATGGIKGYWQKDLDLANEQLKQGRVGGWRMARIYTELGDKDQAFAWLNRAYEERTSLMIFLKVVPFFESLHSDPRFADLLRRIGLPQ